MQLNAAMLEAAAVVAQRWKGQTDLSMATNWAFSLKSGCGCCSTEAARVAGVSVHLKRGQNWTTDNATVHQIYLELWRFSPGFPDAVDAGDGAGVAAVFRSAIPFPWA